MSVLLKATVCIRAWARIEYSLLAKHCFSARPRTAGIVCLLKMNDTLQSCEYCDSTFDRHWQDIARDLLQCPVGRLRATHGARLAAIDAFAHVDTECLAAASIAQVRSFLPSAHL